MSEVQTNTPELDQAIVSLKKKADLLGISYKSNTSVATLQSAIKAKLESPVGDVQGEVTTQLAKGMTQGELITDATDKAMKLVRVIITPMEATKAAGLESEMFCAGNSVVGTVKRTIPFGVEWHVEKILLNTIKEKKFQMFSSKNNSKGVPITTSRLVPAYNIVELPALTDEELIKLAEHQLRTRSLEDE